MVKLKQHEKSAALYCRLSRDDEYNCESLSIQNQKTMLAQYAREKGLINFSFYVDDGFTGTNFDRPDFKRMIGDIEDGKIGTVIVKDLSRLGREYLQTGYYTEIFFPQNDVRFIAVNDNVDSEKGENEFAPFKNIINEFYAKDISRKVKSAFRTRALNGGYCLGTPAYGYKKVENSANRLVPDETAKTVRKMFQMCLEGKSVREIANYLRDLKILIPTAYEMTKAGKCGSESFPKYPYDWSKTTVYGILSNPIYTGKLVCMRYKTKSFKDKRIVKRPENEWITTENAHEALVSESDFETVQQHISVKRDKITSNPDNIFRGLIICNDCGKHFGFSKPSKKSSVKGYYRCSTSIRHGKAACGSHIIKFEQLETVVLHDIQKHASLAEENIDRYVKYLDDITRKDKNGEINSYKKEAEKARKRISELETVIQKMYEDKVFGVISEERYIAMSVNMENELSSLKTRLAELSEYLSDFEKSHKDVKAFAELIKRYIGITELTEELVHMLIEKIVVHGKEVIDNETVIKIDIYYRFIGNVQN